MRCFTRVDRKILAACRKPTAARMQEADRGTKDLWRIRVGEWRVLYLIDDEARLISVTRIAHRREVYKR